MDEEWIKRIVDELHIHPVLARILHARGFTSLHSIQEHLYAKLPDLFDPYLLEGMDRAVDRLILALDQEEIILIYGDNDVDGMTGTALLTEFLRRVGHKVFYHVPSRTEVGMTLLSESIERAQSCQASLVITVDCGITAVEELAELAHVGIDVIITDHHEPTGPLPRCVAALNPKVGERRYPNRDLTGVGVAFKLAHALTSRLVKGKRIVRSRIDLKRYLDLVALGTIADMGALLGENRILVRYGIERLKQGHRVGLRKLADVSGIDPSTLTASEIGSRMAPRLNSLGRISDAQKGVELLLIRDAEAAQRLSEELDLNNQRRQEIELVVSEDVEALLHREPSLLSDRALVLASHGWHPGVIAIVSARLTRLYNRPVLVIAVEENGIGKGSIRTIREFPLLDVLKKNRELLLNFGGHDFAAGVTIREEKIPLFKERFIAAANEELEEEDLAAKIQVDAHVNFADLTFELMQSLNLLEPYGNENPVPILYCDVDQVRPPRIVGQSHLKIFVADNGRELPAIGFNMAAQRPLLLQKNRLRIAFVPTINEFQKQQNIQLLLKGFLIL